MASRRKVTPTKSFYGATKWVLRPALDDAARMNEMIEWKSHGPQGLLWYTDRSELMNRQFTIELRVDYADQDKNEVMRKALQVAARHMFATASLLSDGVKPQIAMFSEDFFDGHADIALIEDTIQQGLDDLHAAGGDTTADPGVSSELMDAVRGDK